MKFVTDTFIAWTATDENGAFTHIGRVLKYENGCVTFQTKEGILSVGATDGKFTPCTQPTDWNIPLERPVHNPPVKVVSTPKARRATGPTKVDQILELLTKTPPTSRKHAIELIVAAGISTPAGASTFYNTAKKLMH